MLGFDINLQSKASPLCILHTMIPKHLPQLGLLIGENLSHPHHPNMALKMTYLMWAAI
jgi:hypothetical protein